MPVHGTQRLAGCDEVGVANDISGGEVQELHQVKVGGKGLQHKELQVKGLQHKELQVKGLQLKELYQVKGLQLKELYQVKVGGKGLQHKELRLVKVGGKGLQHTELYHSPPVSNSHLRIPCQQQPRLQLLSQFSSVQFKMVSMLFTKKN